MPINQKTILLMLLAGILVGFGGGYSFAMIQNKQTTERLEKERTILPRSSMIQEWRTTVAGMVQSVNDKELVVSSGSDTVLLQISPSTKAVKQIIQGEPPSGRIEMKEVSPQELQQGDSILTEATATPQGSLQAIYITILSK